MSFKNSLTGFLCCLMVLSVIEYVDAQGPLRDRIRSRWNSRMNARISPYYEPDRLLDITEWFDGNTYNPTNEVLDRLNDRAQRQSGVNVRGRAEVRKFDNWYGFRNQSDTESNWFYDYYDHGYYFNTTPDSSLSYRYYDTDNDGVYDTYTTYVDRDRDGRFEDEHWYTFDYDGLDSEKDRASEAKSTVTVDRSGTSAADSTPELSGRRSITGTISRVKTTQTPQSQHTVVEVETENDKKMFVDIGPATKTNEWQIAAGEKITAAGPIVTMGDRQLMLADEVEVRKKSYKVERSARVWQGVVVDTKKTQVRGKDTLVAIVYTPEKERVLVDLGPTDQLNFELKKDAEIVVRGVPMEVKNRQIVMAHDVEYDGKTSTILRVENAVNTSNK